MKSMTKEWKVKRIRASLLSVAIFLLFSLISCGGGTIGTGIDGGGTPGGSGASRVSGQILSEDNKPLAGVEVKEPVSNTVVVTDRNGNFSFEIDKTKYEGEDLSVFIGGASESLVIVEDVGSFDASLDPIVIFSTGNGETFASLSFEAEVIGSCSESLSIDDRVSQIKSIPDGTICTVEVRVKADNIKLENLPFAVVVSSCSYEDSTTNVIAEGKTGSGKNAGVGRAQFAFYDSPEHCYYGVILPYNLTEVPELIEGRFDFMRTFSEQKFSDDFRNQSEKEEEKESYSISDFSDFTGEYPLESNFYNALKSGKYAAHEYELQFKPGDIFMITPEPDSDDSEWNTGEF